MVNAICFAFSILFPVSNLEKHPMRVLTKPTVIVASPSAFMNAMERMPKRRQFLSAVPQERVFDSKTRFLLTADHTAGACVADGELCHVFSYGNGAAKPVIRQALELGANRLDCFDGYLPSYYSRYGFREYKRDAWNEDYAPDNWDYATYGRPDVVFMRLDSSPVRMPPKTQTRVVTPIPRMRRIDYLERIARAGLDGAPWYAIARHELGTICERENWNVERFASILAITSPRVTVRRNIRIALQYVGTGYWFDNVLRTIRRGVQLYESTGIIRGQKTSAFRDALLGNENAIVLDVHMANVLGVPQAQFDRPIVRMRCEDTIRRLADRLGLPPASAQACLWYGQKRLRRENPELFPIVAEYSNWLRVGRCFPMVGKID